MDIEALETSKVRDEMGAEMQPGRRSWFSLESIRNRAGRKLVIGLICLTALSACNNDSDINPENPVADNPTEESVVEDENPSGEDNNPDDPNVIEDIADADVDLVRDSEGNLRLEVNGERVALRDDILQALDELEDEVDEEIGPESNDATEEILPSESTENDDEPVETKTMGPNEGNVDELDNQTESTDALSEEEDDDVGLSSEEAEKRALMEPENGSEDSEDAEVLSSDEDGHPNPPNRRGMLANPPKVKDVDRNEFRDLPPYQGPSISDSDEEEPTDSIPDSEEEAEKEEPETEVDEPEQKTRYKVVKRDSRLGKFSVAFGNGFTHEILDTLRRYDIQSTGDRVYRRAYADLEEALRNGKIKGIIDLGADGKVRNDHYWFSEDSRWHGDAGIRRPAEVARWTKGAEKILEEHYPELAEAEWVKVKVKDKVVEEEKDEVVENEVITEDEQDLEQNGDDNLDSDVTESEEASVEDDEAEAVVTTEDGVDCAEYYEEQANDDDVPFFGDVEGDNLTDEQIANKKLDENICDAYTGAAAGFDPGEDEDQENVDTAESSASNQESSNIDDEFLYHFQWSTGDDLMFFHNLDDDEVPPEVQREFEERMKRAIEELEEDMATSN